MRVAVGSDHAGFEVKEQVKRILAARGHEADDVGTHGRDSVDYPDFAAQVGRRVSRGAAELGVLVCGTGIGMSIAANKVDGVRAAVCGEPVSARLARQHNNANVLCLGARIVGPEMVEGIVSIFLESEFQAGRHAQRVEKIHRIEKAAVDGAQSGC